METPKQFLERKGWQQTDKGMFDFNALCDLLTEYSKDLQHHYDSTLGLHAIDRPDLINDPENVLFEIS